MRAGGKKNYYTMTLTMNQIGLNEVEASKLLDFNQKLDINLLDRVVNSLYQGQGDQVKFINLKYGMSCCCRNV